MEKGDGNERGAGRTDYCNNRPKLHRGNWILSFCPISVLRIDTCDESQSLLKFCITFLRLQAPDPALSTVDSSGFAPAEGSTSTVVNFIYPQLENARLRRSRRPLRSPVADMSKSYRQRVKVKDRVWYTFPVALLDAAHRPHDSF